VVSLGAILLCCPCAYSKWLEISNVKARQYPTELAGPKIIFDYDIADPNISPASPAYIFIRYSTDFGKSWQLISMDSLRGNGFDIVDKPGHKQVVWWGTSQTSFGDINQVDVSIRGIAMVRVPAGRFMLKTLPAAGRDESREAKLNSNLPEFYMAKHETTISMYTDYLNEVGGEGFGFNARMANSDRCGVVRHQNNTYTVQPGRGEHPINYVSWYDAANFLQWCGLRLPTESEWEKALRGGLYLDGDEARKKPNPLPERRRPWGDEAPDTAISTASMTDLTTRRLWGLSRSSPALTGSAIWPATWPSGHWIGTRLPITRAWMVLESPGADRGWPSPRHATPSHRLHNCRSRRAASWDFAASKGRS